MTTAAPRELRPYQVEAVEAVETAWREGTERVGVVLPTGTGKSTVIGKTADNGYQAGDPVLMLAHRGELLDQMKADLLKVNPLIPASDIGIVRADEDDHHCPIVLATLQTLATSKRRQAVGLRRRILWDEVHHAAAEGFHATFRELGGYDSALMAGFTATMSRQEGGRVGLGDVIQKVVYEKDILWAIKMGYLVMPHGLTVKVNGLDSLDDIRTVAGDFNQSELAEVMEAATDYVVDAITENADNRRPIIFAASVDAAHAIADALTVSGFPAVAVTGAIPYADRKPLYDAYRSGDVKALVTVQVLTEGADFPMCDAVVLARPTRSKNLYSQMVGRALRLYPEGGKTDALVLDLAGSARTMKLVNLTQLVPGVETREVDENGDEIDPMLVGLDELDGDPDMGDADDSRQVRQGPVELVVVDLLSGSDVTWAETPKGIPFVSLLDDGETVFVWPKDGIRPKDATSTTWAIGQKNHKTGAGGWASGSGEYIVDEPDYVSLEAALEGAERWIVTTGQNLPSKRAYWRQGQPATAKQINWARSLRIVGADMMTKDQLSDEISNKLVSRMLDKIVDREGVDF